MFHRVVDRDAHVVKGAKIGFVTDYLNRPLQDVIAPEAGIVLFIRACLAEERVTPWSASVSNT